MVTLVLGGARSGKSEVAEKIVANLAAGAPVTYVATITPTDADMRARVARHRERRPEHWRTIESGADLATLVQDLDGPAIVDSLGTWVAGVEGFVVDGDRLCRALAGREAPTVIVSEEVGLGVHPSSGAGREFRDALGVLNQQVAAMADRVLLVVAGRALELPAAPG